MNVAHHEQFVAGMGYCDGYFGDRTRPLLWKHWDHELRIVYMKARFYGGYSASRKSTEKLVDSLMALQLATTRALLYGWWIRTGSGEVTSQTDR